MSDNTPESNQDSGSDSNSENKSFSEKYSDVMGKINETLGTIDWTQMGKYGKAAVSYTHLTLPTIYSV